MAVIDRYLSESSIDYKTCNPYTWWNNNKLRYPLLAKLAKQYLCSPPTSVPSERFFSGVGILYEEYRNKLTAEHAEMLLFIKYNMSSLRFIKKKQSELVTSTKVIIISYFTFQS